MAWIWIATIAAVAAGELLPGSSPVLAWVAATGLPDKVMHFGSYLLLAALPAAWDRWASLRDLALLAALGIVLDALQALVPGRGFELADIAANCLGIALGAALGRVVVGLRVAWK